MNDEQARLNKYLNASTRQLVWWRYKKHTLAMVGLWFVGGLYFTALFCESSWPRTTRTVGLTTQFTAHPQKSGF